MEESSASVVTILLQKHNSKGLQEEHHHKGRCKDGVHTLFMLFKNQIAKYWKMTNQKLGHEKAHQGPQSICDDIIDIGRPEGENLQNLNSQGHDKAKENGIPHNSVFTPEDRQEYSQRNKQENIQNTVFQIINHANQWNEISVQFKTGIGNIWHSHQCIDGSQIKGENTIKYTFLNIMKIRLMEYQIQRYQKKRRRQYLP